MKVPLSTARSTEKAPTVHPTEKATRAIGKTVLRTAKALKPMQMETASQAIGKNKNKRGLEYTPTQTEMSSKANTRMVCRAAKVSL